MFIKASTYTLAELMKRFYIQHVRYWITFNFTDVNINEDRRVNYNIGGDATFINNGNDSPGGGEINETVSEKAHLLHKQHI